MAARILIIEDNPANSDLMGYLLTAFGHQTTVAVTGEEGVKFARADRPDLIVCDIHLPGMDGYTVAQHLKSDADLKAVPLIAVTALAMVGDRERVLAAGFDGYITKPIDPETLMAQIDDYLPEALRTPQAAYVAAAFAVDEALASPVKATVLAVDDRPVNLSLIRSILEPLGYRVITAATIVDALRRAREQKPDVILSDVHMADGDGFDFVATVKRDPGLCDVPFIFITSTLCDEGARARGLAAGAARFLFRPIEPGVFVAELEACLCETSG